jgi:hypothetical protein
LSAHPASLKEVIAMFRKTGFMIVLLALIVSLVAGCASASSQSSRDTDVVQETAAAAAPAEYGGDSANKGISAVEPGTGGTGTAPVDRKIVRNANIGLEVVDVAASYDQLLAYAVARQGYETMRNEYRQEEFLTLYATIRIKPEELDGFIAYAETLGTMVNVQISTDDITEGYYDATTRLETMEKSLARYDEFLERAQTIEEVLQVQSQINQITVEIESLKGRLRLWDSMLAESVISLEIRQVNDPVKIKKEVTWSALTLEDMGYLMRSGLTRFSNILVSALQWLLVVLVASSPVWVIALVVFLIVRRHRIKKGPKPPKAPKTGRFNHPSGPDGNQPGA